MRTADHTFIILWFDNLHFAPIQFSWSNRHYIPRINQGPHQLNDIGLETSQQATILLPGKSTMLSYYTSAATCLSLSLQSTKIQAPGHFIFSVESKVLAPCKPISNRFFFWRSEMHKHLFLSHMISLKNKKWFACFYLSKMHLRLFPLRFDEQNLVQVRLGTSWPQSCVRPWKCACMHVTETMCNWKCYTNLSWVAAGRA